MTVEDDRIEHAARAAWETFSVEVGHDSELWRHQNPERQERWRKIARAVLQYAEPTEEVKRLESQLAGLRRAYDHACAQRDRYMRRTVEWREVAEGLNKQVQQYHRSADEHVQKFERKHEALVAVQQQADIFRQAALWLASGVGREHIRRCEIEQCDTCSEVLGIEENAQLDDGVRACTGCGMCSYCKSFPRGLCGNRADHAPHLHDSAGLGRFWCDADQSKRLPFAMERKTEQP